MRKVVLTFDDGPNAQHTPRILDALAKEEVTAVFFVLGEQVQAPGGLELIRRAASEGHLIGNHTFSHPRLTELSIKDVRSQILRTHELIAKFEPEPGLFRPPFGGSNNTINATARELGYQTVLWNTSFEDWRPENQPTAWVEIAMKQIEARHLAICLGHDLPHTAEHLPRLLQAIKRSPNRKFVRYDDRKDFVWLMEGVGRKARECLKRVLPRRLEERT